MPSFPDAFLNASLNSNNAVLVNPSKLELWSDLYIGNALAESLGLSFGVSWDLRKWDVLAEVLKDEPEYNPIFTCEADDCLVLSVNGKALTLGDAFGGR